MTREGIDLRRAGKFLHDRAESAGSRLLPSVRPLAVPNDTERELQPAGSAVLIWYRGSRYIITAAHVIEAYPECTYYLGTAEHWIELPLPFRANRAPLGGRAADTLDFAFRLVDAGFAGRCDGCEFLTAGRIGLKDELVFNPPYRSKFLALGYPLNRFKFLRASKATVPGNLAFTGTIASRDQYAKSRLSPNLHIALEFDPKQMLGRLGRTTAPKILGLSGGGMFRMPSLESPRSAEEPKLSAITTQHDPIAKTMAGVRIDVVLSAMDYDIDHPPQLA